MSTPDFTRRRVVVAAAIVAVILGVGVAAYALLGGDGGDDASVRAASRTTTSAVTTTSTTPTTVPETTVPPTTLPAATTPPTAAAPAAPAPPTGGIAGKTILVDPGHNGQNYAHTEEINRPIDIGTQTRACDTTGTATDGGYTESEYNLDVALRLRAILQSRGANVVMTRSDNAGWGPCIDERAAIGNRAGATAAISIHADGGPVEGRGFHVIYPTSIPGLTAAIAPESQRLALAVRAAYAGGTGMPYADYLGSEGLSVRSDLGGLNLSTVPKVFIETGNMRNATDVALLTDPGFRQRVAESLAAGLDDYLSG